MCHGFTSHIPLCVQWSWISTHTDSCHIGVTSHIHLSSDTCVTDSHYTYRSVKDSFTHVSLLNYMCDVTHMWHESATHVTWLNYVYCGILSHCTQRCMCDMNPLYVWRDSIMCVTGLMCVRHTCDMTQIYVWHVWCESVTHVTWLMCVRHTCDVTHACPSNMGLDSAMWVTWLMCDVNPSHMWHDSCVSTTHVTWLNYMCDMTHVWWKSVTHVTWIMCVCYTCDVTHACLSNM